MSKFDEIKARNDNYLLSAKASSIFRTECGDDRADLIAMVDRLRDGLVCVMDWAGNWDSPFMEDDEWTECDGPRIRALLREVTGEKP